MVQSYSRLYSNAYMCNHSLIGIATSSFGPMALSSSANDFRAHKHLIPIIAHFATNEFFFYYKQHSIGFNDVGWCVLGFKLQNHVYKLIISIHQVGDKVWLVTVVDFAPSTDVWSPFDPLDAPLRPSGRNRAYALSRTNEALH